MHVKVCFDVFLHQLSVTSYEVSANKCVGCPVHASPENFTYEGAAGSFPHQTTKIEGNQVEQTFAA